FVVWDGVAAGPGTMAPISAASMAFSRETGKLSVAVNTAPALQPGSPTLPDVPEDFKNPAGANVTALLGTAVSDLDAGAVGGLAVPGLTGPASGDWQYSVTGGKKWLPMGLVVDDGALLLRPTDKVRFVPAANFHGQAGLTFRAWDQTAGAAGGRADATITG